MTACDDDPADTTGANDMWGQHHAAIHKYFCKRTLNQTAKKWTAPFIPWRGKNFSQCRIKILFVGKKVGINPKSRYDDPWKVPLPQWQREGCPSQTVATERYVREKLAGQQRPSDAFWLVPLLLAGALLEPNTQYRDVVEQIAWTNLYKTTKEGIRVPEPEQCNAAHGNYTCIDCISKKWLKREISILRPRVIVLGLGSSAHRLFEGATVNRLPHVLTTADERGLLGIDDLSTGAWLTRHFSAWNGNAERHGYLLFQIRAHLQNPVN